MLPRRPALLTATVVITSLAAGLGGVSTAQGATKAKGELAPSSILDQTLTWKPCQTRRSDPGLPRTYYRQQCTKLTVPEDWADPNGATIDIKVTRLPATHRPSNGVLFTNPGGPGAAGADLPLVFGDAGRKALLRGQDVYGIDVRGSGGSDNTTCGDANAVSSDPRSRTDPNLSLLLDSAAFVAHACDLAGGSYIQHIDTAETVRDLDLLRSLIKKDKINWLGYSAGTWLGAAYSAAFPEHTGRFVFDSTVDFTGTWQDAFQLQPLGFQRRFDQDFAPWAAKYNKYFKLGTTPAAVTASYEKVRATLADPRHSPEPAVLLDDLLASAMYSGFDFPFAALILQLGASIFDGSEASRLRAMMPLTMDPRAWTTPWSDDAENAAFLAVTCNDTLWSGGRNDLISTSAQLGRQYPLIGWATISQPCAFWDRVQRTLALPTPDGAGVPASLFVQSEHDPATPIEGARRAAGAFTGSHLLVVKNEGDHAIYAGGNACVDKAVESYLNAGTLPKAGATCAGTPLPGPDGGGLGGLSAASAPSASASASTKAMNPLVRLRSIR